MAICKFFQSGNCRNGNRCNFDHVKPNAAATSKYNESSIKLNLTEERPQWKLSVYGPAKEEPNLIVGTDKSCEEDRLFYYTSVLASHEQSFTQMETQVNAILSNPTGAIQHYEKQKSNHSGPFGGPASNAPFAPFTAPPTNAFGGGGGGGGAYGQQSAFGAPKPATAFGQPSAFGTPASAPVSAFGQPSAFGSTSTLGGGGAFGSTSALGGGGSAFGSTSALGGGSAFGSTSALGGGGAFGSTTSGGSAFGSTSALGGGGAFGSTSALGGGGSAFGSTSALSGGGAFGQPSAFGAMANQPATTTPAFGAAPSAFGAAATIPSAFGAAATVSTPSAFGGGAAATNNIPSAFGGAATPSAFGNTSSLGGFGNAGNTGFGTTNNVPGSMQTGSDVNTDSPEWKAFAASEFTYRAIPEIEPPIQLR
ncbi:hypothetical protein HPULCUR_004525 [Helicostylum pulchrum]|uniref:C3H1-type domain-containing protein n=1 Tax=Helicostylum pulchrum TaxID=562976 RepID=A0ABP9XWH1_9FUNG